MSLTLFSNDLFVFTEHLLHVFASSLNILWKQIYFKLIKGSEILVFHVHLFHISLPIEISHYTSQKWNRKSLDSSPNTGCLLSIYLILQHSLVLMHTLRPSSMFLCTFTYECNCGVSSLKGFLTFPLVRPLQVNKNAASIMLIG